MKTLPRFWWLYLLLLLALGRAAGVNAAPQVRLERVPEGGLQPIILMDDNGTVHLVYLKGDPKACDVMYCRRAKGQTSFSSPQRVNSKPGSAIAIGTVRGAQIALGRNRRLHVVWNGSALASNKASGTTPMLYSRLNDAGDGFEPQRDLMTSTTHLDGGGSVAADSRGHVYVVWHGHKTTGPQEEIDRGVFVAFSNDDGKTFTPERQVNPPDTGVCGCCGLQAFADKKGALAIVYRSANLLGNRDTVLLVSTDNGTTFASKLLGQWHVSTCPMSTQAMGPSTTGLLAMWEKAGQIYFESFRPDSLDSGTGTAVAGNTGNRKHPTFAIGRGKDQPFLLAWTEGTGGEKGGSLAWETLDAKGEPTGSGRSDGVPVWSFAAAVAEPDGSFTLLY